jgi:hypothetical protein
MELGDAFLITRGVCSLRCELKKDVAMLLFTLLMLCANAQDGWGAVYGESMAKAITCFEPKHGALIEEWFIHMEDPVQSTSVTAEAVDNVARMIHGRMPLCRAINAALHKAILRMHLDMAQEQNRHRKYGWPETLKYMEDLRGTQLGKCDSDVPLDLRHKMMKCLKEAQLNAMKQLAVDTFG